jgi:hypothetical protein
VPSRITQPELSSTDMPATSKKVGKSPVKWQERLLPVMTVFSWV